MDPITNKDIIGIKGIGVQSVHTNAYGEKWQLGIAVPLNNRRFDFGTVLNLTLAGDSFNKSNINQNETQFGITAISKDINSLPSNFIQYGDHMLLGPSTMTNYEGYSESIRILAATQDTLVDPNNWTNGIVHVLDRKNKYKYQLSDPVTIVGSGIASGWFAKNAQLSTLGIMQGYSALGAMGRYGPNWSNNASGEIDRWEDSIGSNFLGFKIRLPSHGSHEATKNSGPLSGPGAANARGPAITNATLGLGPWRHTDYPSSVVNTLDWTGAVTGDTINAGGIFRYIRKFNDGSDFALVAYNANSIVTFANTWVGLMLGFDHIGGQFKDYAQCLFSMINGLSNEVNTNANIMSNAIFSQLLVSSYEDAQDMSYAKLVGGTYYRLGITWRGTLRPDDSTSTAGSEVFAKFQWGPVAIVGDINHYINSILTTNSLLNSTNRSQGTYKTDMVSGWVETIDTDDLDTWDNLRIDIVLRPKSPQAWAAGRCYRGAEMMLFVDNIFLEHEGDIIGASGNGYVEIDHYPESGTLTVDRFKPTKPAVVTLANGTRQTIDSTGMGERFLHKIEADFSRVDQTIYEQFEQLLRWQDQGYKIALHPFLPKVPHCLIGEFELRNVSKSFWDLTKFSFRFSFVETE